MVNWNSIWTVLLQNRIKVRLLVILFMVWSSIPSYALKCDQVIKETANGVYTLSKGELSLSVSALHGGKIISFKRGNKEMLLQDTVHPKYYGATLWPSPQCRFWPPAPVLDNLPYQAENNGGLLRLVSGKDSLTGFRFTKEFSISQDTALLINYKIENISDTIQHVAAWDIVRVLGGKTFFPIRDRELKDLPSTLEHVDEENGTVWYTFVNDSIKRGQKLFATTKEGWLAHQYGDLLFIKTFPTVPKELLPALQGEVEIFLAPSSLYVELENHGKLTLLEPGEFLTYQQKWFLYLIPAEISNNNAKLEDYVRRRIH